jgi:hypothetical protein
VFYLTTRALNMSNFVSLSAVLLPLRRRRVHVELEALLQVPCGLITSRVLPRYPRSIRAKALFRTFIDMSDARAQRALRRDAARGQSAPAGGPPPPSGSTIVSSYRPSREQDDSISYTTTAKLVIIEQPKYWKCQIVR